MGAAENAELVRRGYEAFNAGDMATLSGLFTDDAVWHVGGNNVLAGSKEGRDAILAYFGELASRSGGTLVAAVQEIIGGDNHTVALQRNTAEHNGRTMDLNAVITFEISDGKVTAGREFFEDTAPWDAFWA